MCSCTYTTGSLVDLQRWATCHEVPYPRMGTAVPCRHQHPSIGFLQMAVYNRISTNESITTLERIVRA